MKLTAVLFSLCVASGVASYSCPDRSTAAYSPPEYFGDCQCNDGYTKNGNYGCVAVPTPAPAPPSPTPEPTQGPSPTPGPALTTGSCVGAGPWANDPNMAVWCSANCNAPYPYCPTTHCSCGGRRLSTQEATRNGEDACENHEFDETQCGEVGCCHFDDGKCWSDVGNNECSSLPSICQDTAGFKDSKKYKCKDWKTYTCDTYYGYSDQDMQNVRTNCPVSCKLCTPDPSSSTCTGSQQTCSGIAEVPELFDAEDCDPTDCYNDDSCSCWQFFKRMAKHEVNYNGNFFSWKQWRKTGCKEDPRLETCTGQVEWSGAVKAITKDDFVDACKSNNAANVRLDTCNAAFYKMAEEVSEDMQHVSEADSWTEAISFADFATNWNNLKAGDSAFLDPTSPTAAQAGFSAGSSGGSTGVSVGVVAMCVVAAVGAGVGVGYFAKGRENAVGTDAKQEEYLEMQARLSDDGSSL